MQPWEVVTKHLLEALPVFKRNGVRFRAFSIQCEISGDCSDLEMLGLQSHHAAAQAPNGRPGLQKCRAGSAENETMKRMLVSFNMCKASKIFWIRFFSSFQLFFASICRCNLSGASIDDWHLLEIQH